MAYRFSAGKTKNSDFCWWLYAENGELVAWAGETFDNAENSRRAASSFKEASASARYEVFQDAGQKWRWRAWNSSDKVAASGEGFDSKGNAEKAAENVKDNALTATGPQAVEGKATGS
jgi:uncharacterized protein YegP (UPF0339 family)